MFTKKEKKKLADKNIKKFRRLLDKYGIAREDAYLEASEYTDFDSPKHKKLMMIVSKRESALMIFIRDLLK